MLRSVFCLISFALSVLFLGNCKKDETLASGGTITDIVVRSNYFNMLEAAVVKANLQAKLSGACPFTVFAPDNAAFTALGITGAVLNSLTADHVKTILLYHTLPANLPSANVPAGPNAKVIAANGARFL